MQLSSSPSSSPSSSLVTHTRTRTRYEERTFHLSSCCRRNVCHRFCTTGRLGATTALQQARTEFQVKVADQASRCFKQGRTACPDADVGGLQLNDRPARQSGKRWVAMHYNRRAHLLAPVDKRGVYRTDFAFFGRVGYDTQGSKMRWPNRPSHSPRSV